MAGNEIKIHLVPPSPILLTAVQKTSLKNNFKGFFRLKKVYKKGRISHNISATSGS